VLGSGATVGAGFEVRYDGKLWKPPMDRDFFSTPVVQSVFSESSYPALSWYQRKTSLEETVSSLDLYLKLSLGGIISEEIPFRKFEEAMNNQSKDYKRKMNRESCFSRLPCMAEWEWRGLVRTIYSSLKHKNIAKSPLSMILRKIPDLGTIITFNYELSLEQCCPKPFVYSNPLNPTKKSGLHLFKLHGSLNWRETKRGVENVSEKIRRSVPMEFHRDGTWVQPSIIGPTLFKQEVTIDFQNDNRAKFYKTLWRMCWDSLREADALVFVGFSFPQTDVHAAALFRSAHLNGKGFRRVVLCHRHDPNLRNTAEQVFSGRTMQITEFADGLENMASRIAELVALLKG
jgi:hypothetical protein